MRLSEIRTDIRNGLNDMDLMRKYDLKPSQLQKILKKMISSGYMDETELYDWFRITNSQVFPTLSQNRQPISVVETLFHEAEKISEVSRGASSNIEEASSHPSSDYQVTHIKVELPITNLSAGGKRGFVRDISYRELRVASSRLEVFNTNNTSILSIRDHFSENHDPITFEAICYRIKSRGKKKRYYVGRFEIVRISDDNLERIKHLIYQLAEA